MLPYITMEENWRNIDWIRRSTLIDPSSRILDTKMIMIGIDSRMDGRMTLSVDYCG